MNNKNRDELLSVIKNVTLDLHKNNFKDLIFYIGGSSAFAILECNFRKTKDIDLLEVQKNRFIQ